MLPRNLTKNSRSFWSTLRSRALFASSNNSRRGASPKARTSEMSCFTLPARLSDAVSLTVVCNPPGMRAMTSSNPSSCATWSADGSAARPWNLVKLSNTVPRNNTVLCRAKPVFFRNACISILSLSMPSISSFPRSGRANPANKSSRMDCPLPAAPVTATMAPAGICSETSSRTGFPRRPRSIVTFCNSMPNSRSGTTAVAESGRYSIGNAISASSRSSESFRFRACIQTPIMRIKG